MFKWQGPIFAKGLWQNEKKARWAGHYFGLGAESPPFHDRKRKKRLPGVPPWVIKGPSSGMDELKLGRRFWRNLLFRRTITQSCQIKILKNTKSELDPSKNITSWMRKMKISENRCTRKIRKKSDGGGPGIPTTAQQLQDGIAAQVQAQIRIQVQAHKEDQDQFVQGSQAHGGMLERLKDKLAEVRSQAANALQRLQDPRDKVCPIGAHLFHLARRIIVPHILERTRDIDELVRRAAYKFLTEKVNIKSLTIGQREEVLGRVFGERGEAVRMVVEKEMIIGWLRLSNNYIVQLFHHFDVGDSDQNTKQGSKSPPAWVVHVLFMDTQYKELVNSFQYLDTDKLIPYEKPTPETVMYWRFIVEFFAEEYLESIMPELTPFCYYVRRYILELVKDVKDVYWEFEVKELISMTIIYDLGDGVGRRNLCKLINDLLTFTKAPAAYINSMVTVFTQVEKTLDVAPSDRMSPEYHSAPETPLFQQVRQDEDVIRAKQLQIAKPMVEINAHLDLSDSCQALDNPAVNLKCRLVVATLLYPSITLLEEFVMVSVHSELPAITALNYIT